MSRTLATLARLRRLQAELAGLDLAQAVAAEREAGLALSQARQVIACEAARADTTGQGAALTGVEQAPLAAAFAAWLPAATHAVAVHQTGLDQAGVLRAQAGLALRARRAAVEAVETLQAEEATLARRRALRRAQVELDEIAGR